MNPFLTAACHLPTFGLGRTEMLQQCHQPACPRMGSRPRYTQTSIQSRGMSAKSIIALFSKVALGLVGVTGHAQSQPIVTCRGVCDASALAMVGEQFFVGADDESCKLRVYSRTSGGAPFQTFDLAPFLLVDYKSPEVDLEAATRLGDRVYWITSHARNKNGKDEPNRRALFASSFSVNDGKAAIKLEGRPYRRLLADLVTVPELARMNLAAASRLAPEAKGGLSIEGLCDTPDGHLLIGFRNPIPDGKALFVPLLNPADMLDGRRAQVGKPLLLDLDGLGVRSLTRLGTRYFMIAGAYDGRGRSFLYLWDGGAEPPRRLQHPELRELNPEAMEFLEEAGVKKLLVASDDSGLEIGGDKCKEVKDPNLRYFRVTTLIP